MSRVTPVQSSSDEELTSSTLNATSDHSLDDALLGHIHTPCSLALTEYPSASSSLGSNPFAPESTIWVAVDDDTSSIDVGRSLTTLD